MGSPTSPLHEESRSALEATDEKTISQSAVDLLKDIPDIEDEVAEQA
jgi:hypothetical protein